MSRPTHTIEVFADVTCPYTHVGLRRLVARRRALRREDIRLWVRAWPLELVNGVPLDAAAVVHKIDELRAQVAPELFSHFDPAQFPATSIPALVLAARAYDRGPAVGEQASLMLRDALFEQGQDISADSLLDDIGRRLGVVPDGTGDIDRVVADWRAGESRQVVGSPHFFVDGQSWFCPSLDISQVNGELRIIPDADRFERFARACFERSTRPRSA